MTDRQLDLARALGISPSAVTRAKAKGMPTTSVEAARQWRLQNVRPRMPSVTTAAPRHVDTSAPGQALADSGDAVAHVGQWGRLASQTLGTDRFADVGMRLRRAMRLVPAERREYVQLELRVWQALLRHVDDALRLEVPAEPQHNAPGTAVQDEAGTETEAVAIWYGLACGELAVVDAPNETHGAHRS